MCSTSGSINTSEYIMNEINLAARLAHGLLAFTIVFAIGLLFELTLQYEGRGHYVAAGAAVSALPQTMASRVA
jgi:hypothetical protein